MLEYVILFIAEYGVYIYGCVDEDVFSGARKGLRLKPICMRHETWHAVKAKQRDS